MRIVLLVSVAAAAAAVELIELTDHGIQAVEFSLGQETGQVVEVRGQNELARSHEVEHVAKELAISVDEVVLTPGVEHHGQRAVEHLTEARVAVFG